MLDLEEYFHLAINASQQNDHHAALGYLKQALEINPDDARCIFLLAAEHAELGLLDRAIEGMERATELDPDLEMAWYQLGLLYIQTGETEKSMPAWKHLSSNAEDKAIRLAAKGLMLVDDDHKEGVSLLAEATNAETPNKFVSESVATIFRNISAIVDEGDSLNASDKSKESTTQPMHSAVLNVYNNPKFNQD